MVGLKSLLLAVLLVLIVMVIISAPGFGMPFTFWANKNVNDGSHCTPTLSLSLKPRDLHNFEKR